MQKPSTKNSKKRAVQKKEWWGEVNIMVGLAAVDTIRVNEKNLDKILILKTVLHNQWITCSFRIELGPMATLVVEVSKTALTATEDQSFIDSPCHPQLLKVQREKCSQIISDSKLRVKAI